MKELVNGGVRTSLKKNKKLTICNDFQTSQAVKLLPDLDRLFSDCDWSALPGQSVRACLSVCLFCLMVIWLG